MEGAWAAGGGGGAAEDGAGGTASLDGVGGVVEEVAERGACGGAIGGLGVFASEGVEVSEVVDPEDQGGIGEGFGEGDGIRRGVEAVAGGAVGGEDGALVGGEGRERGGRQGVGRRGLRWREVGHGWLHLVVGWSSACARRGREGGESEGARACEGGGCVKRGAGGEGGEDGAVACARGKR